MASRTLATFALALAMGSAALAAPPKAVEPSELVVDYAITLAGIPIGQAALSVWTEGDRYESTMKLGLSGLAGVLFGGEGTATSKGRIDPEQPLPGSFVLDATYAGVPIKERMTLDSGIVRSVDITPKPEPRIDRVVVSQADRTGIVDPVAALVMPLTGAPVAATCDRTLPVYDGTMRFDVVLSRGEVMSVSEGPYRGVAVECRARYIPVSGHRPGRKGVKAMMENDAMSVRMAPMGERGPMVPLRISVDTGWGIALIEATSWTVGAPRRLPPSPAKPRKVGSGAPTP